MQKFKTRKGHVKKGEMVVWKKLIPDFMTDESDWENGKIAVHNLDGEVMVSLVTFILSVTLSTVPKILVFLSFEFLYGQAGQKTQNKKGTMDHNKTAVYCLTF